MKAAVFHKPKDIRVDNVPDPEIKQQGDAIIRVTSTAICGSDLHIYNDTASTDIAVIKFPESFSDSLTVVPSNSADISNYLRGTTLNYNLYWKNRKITTKFLKMIVRVTVGLQ